MSRIFEAPRRRRSGGRAVLAAFAAVVGMVGAGPAGADSDSSSVDTVAESRSSLVTCFAENAIAPHILVDGTSDQRKEVEEKIEGCLHRERLKSLARQYDRLAQKDMDLSGPQSLELDPGPVSLVPYNFSDSIFSYPNCADPQSEDEVLTCINKNVEERVREDREGFEQLPESPWIIRHGHIHTLQLMPHAGPCLEEAEIGAAQDRAEESKLFAAFRCMKDRAIIDYLTAPRGYSTDIPEAHKDYRFRHLVSRDEAKFDCRHEAGFTDDAVRLSPDPADMKKLVSCWDGEGVEPALTRALLKFQHEKFMDAVLNTSFHTAPESGQRGLVNFLTGYAAVCLLAGGFVVGFDQRYRRREAPKDRAPTPASPRKP